MTVHNKICCLLVVIFLIVTQSIPVHSQNNSGSPTGNSAGKNQLEYAEVADSQNGLKLYNPYSHNRPQERQVSSNEKQNSNNNQSNDPDSLSSNQETDTSSAVKPEPACYPLLDFQFPIFADLCGTLPQIRYSLPNALAHTQRWQVLHSINTFLSTPKSKPFSLNCFRSLRLLLCPLLFPPCPSDIEPDQVLPCQSFCRIVKNECQAPSLNLFPCHFLPATSKHCPADLASYSLAYWSNSQQTSSSVHATEAQRGGQPISPPSSTQKVNFQASTVPTSTPSQGEVPVDRKMVPTGPDGQQVMGMQYTRNPSSPILIDLPLFVYGRNFANRQY